MHRKKEPDPTLLSCPLLSMFKASAAICRGELCAWWTGERCVVVQIGLDVLPLMLQVPGFKPGKN